MRRNKVVSAEEAARVVLDGDTLASGGFVGLGIPEALASALERRFLATGSPRNLTLIYGAGQGDGLTRGLNHLAHAGMLKRVIGGHWALVPGLGRLAVQEQVEAYCFPLGVLAHLFRDTAAGKPGTLTSVGLHTFVDPRQQGGKLNRLTTEDLVQVVALNGQEYLFFPAQPIDVALVRGTTADEEGNISLEKEAMLLDTLAIAQAAHNSGGIVLAQVERVTSRPIQPPSAVRLPGLLVDAVVVAQADDHPQTFAEPYNPAYTGEVYLAPDAFQALPLDARKVIARRAVLCMKPNVVVNLGIGVPEGIAAVAAEEDVLDLITLTVESGGIGGRPASGLSFGAVTNADAIVDEPAQFDFYDGGGLDQAFLGFAEVDSGGNVNVGRFGERLAGAGGFINISQNAREAYFMGTLTVGAKLAIEDGRLRVVGEGRPKFVEHVESITFSGAFALARRQKVLYITERCVFRLRPGGLELIELAPGIDLQRDVLNQLGFRPLLASEVRTMDPAVFRRERLELRARAVVQMEDRFRYRTEQRSVYLNFEGLRLTTQGDVRELGDSLEPRFQQISERVHVVTNYDHFELQPAAADGFFALIQHLERTYALSSSRYSTKAFFRRQLGTAFAAAHLGHGFSRSFEEARASGLEA